MFPPTNAAVAYADAIRRFKGSEESMIDPGDRRNQPAAVPVVNAAVAPDCLSKPFPNLHAPAIPRPNR